MWIEPRVWGRSGRLSLLAVVVAAATPLLGGQEAGSRPGGFDERAELEARFARDFLPFVENHCASCHSGGAPEGGLDLDGFLSIDDVAARETLLRHAVERVRRGQMPPDPAAAPAAAEVEAFAEVVRRVARSAYDPARGVEPGAAPLRRLNAREYENSVLDVLGVRFDAVAFFPADAIGHGFDNVAEAQGLSELLLERYVEAAQTIAEQAIAWEPAIEPVVRNFSPRELSGGRTTEDTRILVSNGECAVQVELPRRGAYLLRAIVHADQAGPEKARMELRSAGAVLANVEVDAGTRAAPESHEAAFTVEQGGAVWVAAAFVNDFYEVSGERRLDRNLHVHALEVVGPIGAPEPTALQLELGARFEGVASEKERVRAKLAHLARRLWRRPVENAEVARLVELAPKKAPEDQVLQVGVAALLASPNFVFRFEPDGKDARGVRPLTGHELATRLSYFLWSSPPDEALLALADSGALLEPATLVAEARRLLDDPKSGNFARNFASQWLQTRRLAKHAVDPERFPGITPELLAAMERETLLVFEAVLREKRSVLDLLDADFTFVNDALAAHYGLPPVEGGFMRRVSLAGSDRRGIVLHASVLTVTSEPGRTSPVKRGRWLLETLLASPLPPPPPGADSFGDEDPETFSVAGLRERIAAHRARPACASCHDHLDPLGFGLERFDAVGRARERDGTQRIDASGVLPGGEAFDGALELIARMRAHDTDGEWLEGPSLVRAVVEKLLVYALGRGLTPADRPTIGAVLARLDPAHPTVHDALLAIVQSEAFTQRRAGGQERP
jgi:mono/diheme cytochrome c family protein